MPFRVEARLDEAILSDFIKQAITAGTPVKKVKLNLVSSPIVSPSAPLSAVPASPMATKHLSVNAAHQWRSITSSKPAKSPLVVNGAVVWSAGVRPHTAEQPALVTRPSVTPASATLGTSTTPGQRPGIADAILAAVQPPPAGFTLEGQIDLFSIKGLTAQFYSWNGSLPADVAPPVTGAPVYDKAVVTGDFKLSNILAKLKGTPFDNITLRNATFVHQNVLLDSTKALGWHVDADFVIEPSCGKLYDLLRTVLKVQEPILHLHAGLGTRQDWGKSLTVASFTLDGTFPGIQVPVCKGFTLTTVGAELLGIHRMERQPTPHTVMDFGFAVFGSFNLDVPGSVIPLELDYRISELGGYVQLSADLKGDLWNDALGVKGLQVWNLPVQEIHVLIVLTFLAAVRRLFQRRRQPRCAHAIIRLLDLCDIPLQRDGSPIFGYICRWRSILHLGKHR